MAADDQTPLDPEPDPPEDTLAEEVEEPAEADDQSGSDPATRLAEAQALITRQAQELSLYRERAQAGEDDEAPPEATSSDDLLARATQDSWALAEAIHGPEAIDAYRVAYRLIERAATPADHVTAFEAYYAIRSGKPAAQPKDAGGTGKTRAEATQPRVDANRSDPGSDLANAQEQIAEARKQGSLDKFAAAAAAAMGFGPSRR